MLLRAAASLLWVVQPLLVGGCAPEGRPRAPAPATASASMPDAGAGPGSFGVLDLRAGQTRAAVLAAHPDLVVAPEQRRVRTATTTTSIEGVPVQLSLHFHADRLFAVSLTVVGPAATEAAFRRLSARLQAAIGAGHSTRCAAETAPGQPALPIEQDIAQGTGLLSVDWRSESLYGHLSLTRSYAPATPLTIAGSVTATALAPPCQPDDGLICDAREDLPPGSSAARRPGVTALLAYPLRVQSPRACPVLPPDAPAASLFGLAFGSSPPDAAAALGSRLRELVSGVQTTQATFAGVPGELVLRFYADCLAVAQFIVRGREASLGAYEALRAWARPTLGQGQASRCGSEDGIDEAEYIELGLGQRRTLWRDSAPLTGEIHIGTGGSLQGPGPRTQIVLEVQYEPLRSHAPHIDFDDAR